MPEYAWPVRNPIVTSRFHSMREYGGQEWLHSGTDFIDAKGDDSLYLPESGVVLANFYEKTMGNHIRLRGDDGSYIRMMHMRAPSPLVVGRRYQQGTFAGWMGNTGLSSGKHLHIDASFATNAESVAELMGFGYDLTTARYNTHWRLNQSFFNLELVFGREVPQEDDDMYWFNTSDTKRIYLKGATGKRHVGPVEWKADVRAGAKIAFTVTQAEANGIPNQDWFVARIIREMGILLQRQGVVTE